MPVLNTADRLFLGTQRPRAVYVGPTKVWTGPSLVNLLPSNQADAEDGSTTGFGSSGGSVATTQTRAAHGAWSVSHTGASTRAPTLFVGYPPAAANCAVVGPDKKVTLLAAVWPDEPSRTCTLSAQCYSATNASLGTVNGPATPVTGSQWNYLRAIVTTLPNTAYVTLTVKTDMSVTGRTWQCDRFGVYEGVVLTDEWQPFNPPPGGVRNLLPVNFASFENGTVTGITVSGGTGVASQDRASHGTWSLKVTKSGASAPYALFGSAGSPSALVIAGRIYTLMAQTWTAATGVVNLGMQWFDSAGAAIGGVSWGSNYTIVPNGWQQHRRVTVVAPAGAARMLLFLNCALSTVGDVLYSDRVGIYEGDIPASEWAVPA